MEANWYAVYTKPRWEKKVAETLTAREVINYCPLNKVVHQWSDRKKTVLEPLFTSYVFLKIPEKQFNLVKQVNGIVSLVSWLGKPAIIPEKEIELIRQFLKEHPHVKLEKAAFAINDPVKILQGPLMDKEGKVLAIKNNYLKVALPSLGYTLCVELEMTDVARLTETQLYS
jgi:transcription antitermination factor NusG